MADRLTDAELTVLGLLAERPRHGYDLDRTVEERGMRQWTSLGSSSIYYLLDKLVARGLVERDPAPAGSRRSVHRLTATGHRITEEQSLDALDTPSPVRGRVLIGIANSRELTSPAVQERLRRRLGSLRAQLEELDRRSREQEPLPSQAAALFDYGRAMLLADAAWTEDLLR
ncbi:DNA-binding PadR family transcriptional regulator [Kineococcus xinjiangensis]|uniref:DNA-binding PadR family transcriptional regulator n=1 Tax=Kineococcus xinjiangensis TaxID=512762 RepID=A0A2S6IV68_9ACTN|nr:PadR family transcriptional regulator [Kineococcus xinjiangensis]PPK98170.1 DNA-binding PadR family transcriptional regulator [Kineococcus xinjiangensis]